MPRNSESNKEQKAGHKQDVQANDMFKFKQFTIDDSACAMKVGTDGVILGAWAEVSDAKRILDVGTGSGLIALMISQRNAQATVDAIDIDGDAVSQASANVKASPFGSRIRLKTVDFAVIEKNEKYDAIVSNPPFYNEQTNCPDTRRDAARHTSSLPFETLICKARAHLNDDGCLSVIIPYGEASNFIATAAAHKLALSHRTDIHPNPRKEPKRTLLTFKCKRLNSTTTDKLFIRNEDNEYSTEYKLLTKDFYLNF